MINDNASIRPYRVRFQDCDSRGQIHLYRLMDYEQDCDDRNCALFEATAENLYDRDACWILLAQEIRLTGDLPVGDDQILIESWSMGHEGIRFYRKNRYYRNRADEAHCFGQAISQWILCSMGSHRPLRPATVLDMDLFYQKSDPQGQSSMKIAPLSPLENFDGPGQRLTYQVAYGDLDFNQHLHNTHYLRLALDAAVQAIGLDPSRDSLRIREVHIQFMAETNYLEKLAIVARQDPEQAGLIRLEGRSGAGDQPSFLAAMNLEIEPGQD